MAVIPNTNVNLATNIRDVLNAGNDVASFFSKEKINKWSFYKPVELASKLFDLDEEDFFAVNDGLNVMWYDSAPEAYSAVVADGMEWEYILPSSVFRVGDFRGYDSDAEPWFTMSITNGGTSGNVELGSSVRFELATDIQWLLNFETFQKFNLTSGGVLDLGFLMHTSTSTTRSVIYYKICDILDIGDFEKQLNVTFPSSGSVIVAGATYHLIPVLTTDTRHTAGTFYSATTDESVAGNWCPLPATPCALTISQSGSGDMGDIGCTLVSVDYTFVSTYMVRINSCTIEFTNTKGSSVVTNSIDVYMQDYYSAAADMQLTYSGSLTIPAAGMIVDLTMTKDYGYYEYESVTANPTLAVEVQIGTTLKTFTFNFEKEGFDPS